MNAMNSSTSIDPEKGGIGASKLISHVSKAEYSLSIGTHNMR
jgi:hypothetical protein